MLLAYIATVGSYNDVSQFGPNDTSTRELRSFAKVQQLNIPKILNWVVYTLYLIFSLN